MIEFYIIQYHSIVALGPDELYGMGKESLIAGGCGEASEFRSRMQDIAYNSRLENHYISDLKIQFFTVELDKLHQLQKEGKAYFVCGEVSPCGLYGCKYPEKHDRHWVLDFEEGKKLAGPPVRDPRFYYEENLEIK